MRLQLHSRASPRRRADGNCRRGVMLVAVLVCLLIVMTMLGRMLQGTLRSHTQLRSERDLRQTELLLEAGSDRAAFRLARDADYGGETWTLPADAITGTGAGQVTIKAVRNPDKQSCELKVLAEYPLGHETSIHRTRVFQIPLQLNRQ